MDAAKDSAVVVVLEDNLLMLDVKDAPARFYRRAGLRLLARNGQHGRSAFRPGRQGQEIRCCRVSRARSALAPKVKGAKPVYGLAPFRFSPEAGLQIQAIKAKSNWDR
jgi:hypothetical protein